MKFTLVKLSVLALVATSAIAVSNNNEKPALRGVAVSDTVVEVEGSANSNSIDSESASNDLDLPDFFPSEMTAEQIVNFKMNKAQKRQKQRDERRAIDNPNRSQAEEDKERKRKTDQSERSNDSTRDPYYNNGSDSDSSGDYGRNREASRVARCEIDGNSCNFSGPQEECYNDCLDDIGVQRGDRCAQTCKYIDTDCYEDCRDRGDSIGFCLDKCEDNIDTDGDRRTIRNKDNNSNNNKNNSRNSNRNINNNNGSSSSSNDRNPYNNGRSSNKCDDCCRNKSSRTCRNEYGCDCN